MIHLAMTRTRRRASEVWFLVFSKKKSGFSRFDRTSPHPRTGWLKTKSTCTARLLTSHRDRAGIFSSNGNFYPLDANAAHHQTLSRQAYRAHPSSCRREKKSRRVWLSGATSLAMPGPMPQRCALPQPSGDSVCTGLGSQM